jgi:hypothetical protein
VTPPRADAVELWTRIRGVSPPRPPWDLGSWSSEAETLVVWLDATDGDLADVAFVAAQVPAAAALAPGRLVLVLGAAVRVPARWARLWRRPQRIMTPRSARCGALLSRGYVDIGCTSNEAKRSEAFAWGWAPRTPET